MPGARLPALPYPVGRRPIGSSGGFRARRRSEKAALAVVARERGEVRIDVDELGRRGHGLSPEEEEELEPVGDGLPGEMVVRDHDRLVVFARNAPRFLRETGELG